MSCGSMKVTCEDGFEVTAKNQDELVNAVQHHLKTTHQKQASRDEIMKMAKHP